MDVLKKISYVSFGNILNALLGVTFLTAVARELTVFDFGRYAVITTLLVAMSKVIDSGSNSVYVANAFNSSEDDINKNTFLTLKVIMYFVAAFFGILVLILVLDLPDIPNLLVPFLLGLLAYTINISLFTFFQKSKMYLHAVGLNTIPALLKGLAAFYIFMFSPYIDLLTAYKVFSYSMFSCVLLLFLLPKEYFGFSFNLKGSWGLFKRGLPGGVGLVIQHSWPTVSSSMTTLVKNFVDAGLFAIPDKIANIFVLISVSVFTVLLPENAERKDKKGRYYTKETLYVSLFIILLGVLATIIARFAVPLVFGEEYQASIPLIGVLIMASSITSIHTFLENYFYVEEKVQKIMYLNLFKLTFFLIVGYLALTKFGLIGLAYTQLIASILTLSLTLVFFRVSLKISLDS